MYDSHASILEITHTQQIAHEDDGQTTSKHGGKVRYDVTKDATKECWVTVGCPKCGSDIPVGKHDMRTSGGAPLTLKWSG